MPGKERRLCLPAMVSRAAIVALACAAGACATPTPATPPMQDSCKEWTARSDEERFAVVGAALEQQVGGPAASNLASCLWLLSEQIATQSAAVCERDGGSFDSAMGRAIESAITYCQGR